MTLTETDTTKIRHLAWVRAGQDVSDCADAVCVAKEAGFDWTVRLEPTFFKNGESYRQVTDRFAVVRDDINTPIGSVGSRYVPVQYADAFGFLDHAVAGQELQYMYAGELRKGRVAFIAAKMPGLKELAGEKFDFYIIARTSHDGTSAVTIDIMPINIMCSNGMCLTIPGVERKWSMTHTSDINERISEARETLQIAEKYQAAYALQVEKLKAKMIEVPVLKSLLKSCVPDTRYKFQTDLVDGVVNMLKLSPTIHEEDRHTAWGAVMATTEWLDHIRPSRSPNSAFHGLLEGDNSRIRNRVAAIV